MTPLCLGWDGSRWGYATNEQWRARDKANIIPVVDILGDTADPTNPSDHHGWPHVIERN